MAIYNLGESLAGGFKRLYPNESKAVTTDRMESGRLLSDFIFSNFPFNVNANIFLQLHDKEKTNAENLNALHQLFVSKQTSINFMSVKMSWLNAKTLECKNADEAVTHVIKHKLTSANFSQFPDFADSHLKILTDSCPHILDLSICSDEISGDAFAEALGKLTGLQSLNVRGSIGMDELELYRAFLISDFKADLETSEDQAFKKFFQAQALVDDKIIKALGKLTKLQNLNISKCKFIAGDKFAEALGKLTLLQSLDLSDYQEISKDRKLNGDKLAEALGKLTLLESLNLSKCEHIPDAKLTEALGKLTKLQNLNLSDCTKLSDNNLADALSKLTKLQNLNLSGCMQISGDKVAEALGKLLMLQSLKLNWCTRISGDTLVEALGKLTLLESLNLSWCKQISSDKLAEVLGRLTMLKSLILRGCMQISDDKVPDAIGGLVKLQHLNVSMCLNIPGIKLMEAIAKLINLQSLDFSDCKQIL